MSNPSPNPGTAGGGGKVALTIIAFLLVAGAGAFALVQWKHRANSDVVDNAVTTQKAETKPNPTADIDYAKVAGSDLRGDVEVENDFAFALLLDAIEESPQVALAFRGGGFDAVDLEVVDAVGPMQLENAVGVLFPIAEAVARIRRVPETELHAACGSLFDERLDAIGESRFVGQPEVGILGPEPVPDAAGSPAGVDGASRLPAIIDLDDVDAECAARFDLLAHEIGIDAEVA